MKTKAPVHFQGPPVYPFHAVCRAIHLSGKQTGEKFSLMEATMPSGGDGGLHAHSYEHESLHVLAGELEATNEKDLTLLGPRESCFEPRNTPRRLGDRGAVATRAFLIDAPAAFDAFLRNDGSLFASEQMLESIPNEMEIRNVLELAGQFGVQLRKPPENHLEFAAEQPQSMC